MAMGSVTRCWGKAGTYEVVCRPPAQHLRKDVLCYRGFRVELAKARTRLEVPDGAVSVMLGLGGELRLRNAVRPAGILCTAGATVSGMRSEAWMHSHAGHIRGVEVLMTPRGAFTAFGIDLHELADRAVRLSDLFGTGTESLLSRLAHESTWGKRFSVLDEEFTVRVATGDSWSRQVDGAWTMLRRSHGTLPTAQVAAEVGWSLRHLEGQFRRQVGLSPKVMARVLRLQRTLRLLDHGHPAGQVAVATGFHDQSHMCHEIKNMVGLTIRELLFMRSAGWPEKVPDRIPNQVTSMVLPAHFGFLQDGPPTGQQTGTPVQGRYGVGDRND
ncbi:helix-turn-helix domain-containing protein [Streptomyces sp. NPDC017529]|uniref:helix-turn-helix domain-containing protein n=1 Tax=Streptomyces sp. NPDC017529 TaxID=3365000 RepID=UPI0037B7164A